MSILNLNSPNTPPDGQEAVPQGRIASFLSSSRDSGLSDYFSFMGRIGRKEYWLALLWAHLVPMIACLPFMAWATAVGIEPGHWRFAIAFRTMSAGEAIGILGIVAAGGLYYWMLAAAFVKRFRGLNLPGWMALTYLAAVCVALLGGTIGNLSGWMVPIYLARYFYPILLMAQGRLSEWGAVMFYLTPYVYLLLLILQGTIKGPAEPDGAARKTVAAAFVALALCGGIAEAAYGWYGVYHEVAFGDHGLIFSMHVHRVEYAGYGEITAIEGLTLYLNGSGDKQVEVPLVSPSVVGDRIETRDFGVLKIGGDVAGGMSIFATRSQIAGLSAFRLAHQ